MKIEIEIKTPTIITSGEIILNLELFKKGNSLYRIEKNALFSSVLKDEKKSTQFLEKFKDKLSQQRSDISDLYDGVEIKDEILIKPEIIEFPREFMKTRQQILDYVGYISKINDEVYYLPYIPGSSIKGAVRNSVVWNILRKIGNQNELVSKIEQEHLLLYKDNSIIPQLRDVFRFIQFSDFHLRDITNFKMGIGLVKRISISNKEGKIPSYTYYLLPGTKFYGEINISINLKNYIKNNMNRLNKNFVIQELILNNYKNDKIDCDQVINYLLKNINDFTNSIANNDKLKFLFSDEYNVKLSNGVGGKFDAFIGRFKGIYLNIPRPKFNVKTYPVLFTANNEKYKMGHIQLRRV